MLFKAAILDFDGVVVNSEIHRLETYKTLFKREYDIDLELTYGEFIGRYETQNMQEILDKYSLQGDIQELSLKRKPLLENMIKSGIPPIPSIHVIIQYFNQNNIPFVIASNSSRRYIERVISYMECKINAPIVSKESVENPKPSPDIFYKAADILDEAPQECLVFEDSPIGIKAAQNASMKSVGVLSELSREELSEADFFLEIHAEQDLDWVFELFKKEIFCD